MLLTTLTLENIKSYAREEIRFEEGLNAISGHNGSGKTTILEAIGYALFGFLPYAQADFVREGQKNGTVRVGLIASDGRQYEVVRRVGGGGTYYVADVETGMRVAERAPNVLDWIRTNALGIDGDTSLESLFKNAVGVPQGLMTADFQNTAQSRKAVFDPLLRVEEYRDAYEQLRETRSYLAGTISTANEEIARLETQTAEIPPLRAEITRLEQALQSSEVRLAELVGALEDAESGKQVLDRIERELIAQRQGVAEKQTEVAGYHATLEQQEQAAEAARIARRESQRAEPGYRAVVEARQRLTSLDERRRERDALEQRLAGVTAHLQGVNENIKKLEMQAQEARHRAEEAAALNEAVVRQGQLDSRLHDAALRLQAEQGLRNRAAVLEREAREGERQIGRLEREIAAADEARQVAVRLEPLREELRALGDTMAAVKARNERLLAVEAEGKKLRERYDRLDREAQRLQAVREQIEVLAPQSGALQSLIDERQTLGEERVRIRAAIEYQGLARSALEQRHCPLLELQCPAVSAEPALLDRFDTRVAALEQRLPALEREWEGLHASLTAAQEAAATLQKVQVEAAQLASSESLLEETAAQLRDCRTEYAELKRSADEARELAQHFADLRNEERALRQAAERAGRLEPLQQQLDRERELMVTRQSEVAGINEELAVLAGVRAEAADFNAQLQSLNDPRARQQALLAVAGRAPELRKQIEVEQGKLQDMSDRLRALVAQKQQYLTLDRDIETQNRIVDERGPDYERYLAYREEAGTVETREMAAAQTRNRLARARDEEREARDLLERTERRYDAEQHAGLRLRCDELGRDIASENMNHEHLRHDLGRQQEQLSYLQRQEVKLQGAREEREALERSQATLSFIRDTIKTAGPAITETLLRNISQVANDFYAEIMDDHAAELRWDRDYEVVVQRGAETRKFVQLSGGEQMSAALAVRLALLKEMSEVDVAFFDEPTQNMDEERRFNLAGQIRQVRGFRQLIVISHDDTFEHDTDRLIRLQKINGETRVSA